MSDDDDELPPISVNSSTRDSSLFSMPSATEVAGARSRAARCEQELALLHEQHFAAPPLHHSDSSGSEGDAALAAAVSHLQVITRPQTVDCTTAAILTRALAAIHPDTHPPLVIRYLAAARAATGPQHHAALDRHMVEVLAATMRGTSESLPVDEAEGAAMWTLAACGAPSDPRDRHTLLRLAHCLLDSALDDEAVERVCSAVEAGVSEYDSARVEVCDALRGGGSAARRVAARLASTARAGVEHERYAALQLVGRAPPPDAEATRSLLDALAPRYPHPTPEQLKMIVAASKIRVLFNIGR